VSNDGIADWGGVFSDNHKGKDCPYKNITCQEGYCFNCQIFKDKMDEAEKRIPKR